MLAVITAIQLFLAKYEVVIMGLVSIAFTISKLASTERAKHLIQLIQFFFDSFATIFEILGSLAKKTADFLANLLKSDGFMGKK